MLSSSTIQHLCFHSNTFNIYTIYLYNENILQIKKYITCVHIWQLSLITPRNGMAATDASFISIFAFFSCTLQILFTFKPLFSWWSSSTIYTIYIFNRIIYKLKFSLNAHNLMQTWDLQHVNNSIYIYIITGTDRGPSYILR